MQPKWRPGQLYDCNKARALPYQGEIIPLAICFKTYSIVLLPVFRTQLYTITRGSLDPYAHFARANECICLWLLNGDTSPSDPNFAHRRLNASSGHTITFPSPREPCPQLLSEIYSRAELTMVRTGAHAWFVLVFACTLPFSTFLSGTYILDGRTKLFRDVRFKTLSCVST